MTKFNICDFDIIKLSKELTECRGAVTMTTAEGDVFNMKSVLSRIIGVMNIIQGGVASGATIECEDPEDEKRLREMMTFTRKSA